MSSLHVSHQCVALAGVRTTDCTSCPLSPCSLSPYRYLPREHASPHGEMQLSHMKKNSSCLFRNSIPLPAQSGLACLKTPHCYRQTSFVLSGLPGLVQVGTDFSTALPPSILSYIIYTFSPYLYLYITFILSILQTSQPTSTLQSSFPTFVFLSTFRSIPL